MTDKVVAQTSNPMHRLEELAIPNGAVVQASFTKAEAQQLLAVLRVAPETSEWLPMATAPRDGTSVHLGFAHMQNFDVIAHWSDGDWSLSGDGRHAQRLHGRPAPAGWRPLPTAPGLSLKAFVHLCAPHGKDWLTCPECAKAAGIGSEQA